MARTLIQLLPPTRSGRTFVAASSLLGLGAFLQLALLAWYFLSGSAHSNVAGNNAPAIRFAETTQPVIPTLDGASATSSLTRDFHNSTPAPPENYSVLPQPTPAPNLQLPGGATGDALEQARALRQRGDMRAALGRLREALVAEPENPQAIAEMAITYEAMQLPDKAAEQWQRIYAMGESVGALYYLADAKMHGGAARGASGHAADLMLKIADIHAEELSDPAVEKKIALKIVVKGRPGVVIDPDKVKIEAYFYDLIDGKEIVQTDAQTDYAWLTPPPINWANDKSEVLEALYVRPKPGSLMPSGTPRAGKKGSSHTPKPKPAADATDPQASPAESPSGTPGRDYLGYSVRLYYDRQLQEVQADPEQLVEKFRAPPTLSSD